MALAADEVAGFAQHRKPTRRDAILETMELTLPWAALFEVIKPHYFNGSIRRPAIELERRLRIYFP